MDIEEEIVVLGGELNSDYPRFFNKRIIRVVLSAHTFLSCFD